MMSRDALIIEAQKVRFNAYAKYSGYRVGAVVISSSGRIFTGCNVENVSFGATICAERNAIAAMIAAGEIKVAELVIATVDFGQPCGMCLQVLNEFCGGEDVAILLCKESGNAYQETSLRHLLPHPFSTFAAPFERET